MPSYIRRPSPVKVQVRSSSTSPSAHQGFIRGAIALHSLSSSGQHRSPDCGPTAVPRPYKFEQEHEERGGDRPRRKERSFFYPICKCSKCKKCICSPRRHPGTTIPQTWLFSPEVTNPSHSELLCPAQVTRKRRKEGEGESPYQHPGMISTTWEIDRLGFPSRPAHVSTCNLPGACCREASFSTAGHPTWPRVLILLGFVPPRTPPHELQVHRYELYVSLNSLVHCATQMNSRVHHA